ncbi:MAG: hypothetical protein IKT65_07520 [Clostridia bacterium]|nr:hypothetical protein [Clostridia bacterium]
MKRSIGLWQLIGFAATSLGGTLLHFLYKWSNESVFVAPFSGINESTWEHMKLLFFPMLVFAFMQSFYFKEYGTFWCIKLKGILFGLLLIPVLFYTYNGVIGTSPDWINIAIFFISAAAVYVYEARMLLNENPSCISKKLAVTILCIIAVMFVVFTFATPNIAIFEDPLTKTYGIKKITY